jgi:hypothetical protein
MSCRPLASGFGTPSIVSFLQVRFAGGVLNPLASGQHDKPVFRIPFAFRLSPFIFLALSAFCLTSCSLNPDMQGRGVTNLQGEWQQDSSTIQQKLVTSSSYHIRFDCDSFFVQINSTSKVNYGADSCMRSGHWSEYIKGNYAQKNDTLYLKGLFCNPDFSYKENTDCFRTGPYKEFFKIVHQKDSVIQLSGTSSVIPIQLHLVKRTSCTPKPL